MARKAETTGDEALIALKVLLPSVNKNRLAVTMFMDEAAIMTQIHHPNVLEVHDFGKEQDRYYLAMEYLRGQSLSKVIMDAHDQKRGISYIEVAAIAAATARGLSSAHLAKGRDKEPLNVVHRDVTPQNIFLTYKGRTKVIDFGIARASERLTETMVGMFKGKAAYMAPEQIDQEAPDARVDIFALGVCLWEMITQKRLFYRETPIACLQAILQGEIPSPTQIAGKQDVLLDEIVFNALERDVNLRTASAQEMESALVSYLKMNTSEYEEIIVQELMRDLYSDLEKEEAKLLDQLMRRGHSPRPESQRLQEISGIAPGRGSNPKRVITLAAQVDERETYVLELGGVRDTMPCAPRPSIMQHLRDARTESVHRAVEQLSGQLPNQSVPVAPAQTAVEAKSGESAETAAPRSVLSDPTNFRPKRPWRAMIVAALLTALLLMLGLKYQEAEPIAQSIELEERAPIEKKIKTPNQ
jgi:serine/threonine protein kinase